MADDRPILFNDAMVRAILSGTKTQTRRLVKPQPPADQAFLGWIIESTASREEGCAKWGAGDFPHINRTTTRRCPYGKPGDRLWVREAWRIMGDSDGDTLDMFDSDDVQYRADRDESYIDKYRPSIHMPRRFSRIDLEVTAVRVERLQQIDEADCWAEGIASSPDVDPVHEFRDLWESINGPGSWDANPWVWVIEFKRAGGGNG